MLYEILLSRHWEDILGFNGFGVIFFVNTNGTGFTVLHTFTGGSDGTVPNKYLVLFGNILSGPLWRPTRWLAAATSPSPSPMP